MHAYQKKRRAQAPSAIPNSHAPGALTVTDGQTTVGTIVERDGSHFAFDHTGTLIGEHPSRRDAMGALPRAVS